MKEALFYITAIGFLFAFSIQPIISILDCSRYSPHSRTKSIWIVAMILFWGPAGWLWSVTRGSRFIRMSGWFSIVACITFMFLFGKDLIARMENAELASDLNTSLTKLQPNSELAKISSSFDSLNFKSRNGPSDSSNSWQPSSTTARYSPQVNMPMLNRANNSDEMAGRLTTEDLQNYLIKTEPGLKQMKKNILSTQQMIAKISQRQPGDPRLPACRQALEKLKEASLRIEKMHGQVKSMLPQASQCHAGEFAACTQLDRFNYTMLEYAKNQRLLNSEMNKSSMLCNG